MPTIDFAQRFHPLTAHPFDREDCREVPPCPALAPYVRCFWGPVARKTTLVVPDACADIIIRPGSNGLEMHFCPVSNTTFTSSSMQTDEMFAVRFNFWALAFFGVRGCFDEGDFPDLRTYLLREGFLEKSFEERQDLMEVYLLRRLTSARNADLLNGVDRLISTHGRISVQELAAHMAVSSRTAERLFRRHTGLTPKEAAEVIRYQTLWRRSLMQSRFSIQEQVEDLGFCDQAHLLNSFRKFHSISLGEAVARAKHVAFLQDGQAQL